MYLVFPDMYGYFPVTVGYIWLYLVYFGCLVILFLLKSETEPKPNCFWVSPDFETFTRTDPNPVTS